MIRKNTNINRFAWKHVHENGRGWWRYCYNSFKGFLCRTSVKNFPFRQKREEIVNYLFFWCYEEERQTSDFAKNNWYKFISAKSIIMD